MSKESKRRTISYKLVKIGNQHPVTIQEMLEATLLEKGSHFHFAKNRREALSDIDKSFRFINRYVNYDSDMLLCQLVQFEEGRSQMTISIDENANMFEVTPISAHELKKVDANKPKDSSNNSTEFLESVLYFGVMGNHMVVMGTRSLSAKELERHLSWYFNTLTSQLENQTLYLSDRPTANAIKQIEKASAKSIQIGSDIAYEQKFESYQYDVSESKSVRWTPAGLGGRIIECLKENGYIGNFNFNESLDDANLQVSIEFKYKRKTTKTGQKVLDQLSTSLRHLDKEDVKINLKDGGEIKGDDLRLSHHIQVSFYNGQVDEPALHFQMKNWLMQKIMTKEVSSDLADIIKDSSDK